ncbi:MAG: hypothetical protein WCF23_21695 [Candidatus Nitrosopolaris sp.]
MSDSMLEINILQRKCNVTSTYLLLPRRSSQWIQVIVRMHQYNQKKTIRTDQKFSVSMVVIATVAILTIGSTSTTNVHAQVDCSANPDDPSCQGSSGSTDKSGSTDNSGSSSGGSNTGVKS